MYTDIIQYKLAEGVTQEKLMEAAHTVLDVWMKSQPGFMSWQINTLPDGGFVDIVHWASESAAKDAEKSMQSELDPAISGAWFGCYDMESIQTKNATQVHLFKV